MNILSIKSFRGANIYCMKPVILLVIRLENAEEKPTTEFQHFNQRLLGALPGLKEHFCSLGYEGGFLKRLNEGTYLPHVTEHVILELQHRLGYDVAFGKTREGEDGCYNVVYRYENEAVGIACGRAAVDLLSALRRGEKPNFPGALARLKRLAEQTDLGPSTQAILEEARRRSIPVRRLGSGSLLQLGYGKYARRVEASMTDGPSCIAVDIASDKQLTKDMLSARGIPVPDGMTACCAESAVEIAETIGYPVVVKPIDSNHGSGVSIRLQNAAQVRIAFEKALEFSHAVIVERHIEGLDYRVLVVGGRVCAVAERRPAQVIGDGMHSIRSLVERENKKPIRGEGHTKPLTRIELDETAVQMLAEAGLTPSTVPAENTRIVLRRNANLSTGGTARAIEAIHPQNAEYAVQAARAMGLDVAGIDICSPDLSVPLTENGGAVIEVNACPGLRMHLAPSEGEKAPVAQAIVEMMFPEGQPFSIPIVSVTGTNGKTTTTRLIAHALKRRGLTVGMTTTSGIFIGDELIAKGDNTGAISATAVLSDPTVEAAVLETARGGIIRRGLGYEYSDVAVVTNLSDDHLGQDGLFSLEDIAHVKSLVVEAVRPDGWAVLNADDSMVRYFMDSARCNLFFFSKDPDNPILQNHIQDGGRAVCLKDGEIRYLHGKKERPIATPDEIPLTHHGKAECNIENAMAAAAALLCLGVPCARVRAALRTFQPNDRNNPGRFNIYQAQGIRIMLDYGHNAKGYERVIDFLEKQESGRQIGIIGVPGDRPNEAIEKVGALCARHFDRIIIKEDQDKRGRKPGEVAKRLKEAARRADAKDVEVVLSEKEALKKAIREAKKDDFITVFYEEYEPLKMLVSEYAEELTPPNTPEPKKRPPKHSSEPSD